MEKSKKIKIIATTLILLLVSILITISSVFATLYFIEKSNTPPPTIQVGGNDSSVEKDDVILSKPGKVYDITNVAGVEFMNSNTAAEQILCVQVTVHPFFAADKRLTWSLAWKNPSSEWANGKSVSDYVTYVVDSENLTIATLTEKQPFGETIVATITPVAFPDKAIQKDIDHVGGVVDYEASFKYNNKTYYFSKNSTSGDGNVDRTLNIKAVKGATITDFNVEFFYAEVCSKESTAVESLSGFDYSFLGNLKYTDVNSSCSVTGGKNNDIPLMPLLTSHNVENKDYLCDYRRIFYPESSKDTVELSMSFKSFEDFFATPADNTKHNFNSILNDWFSRTDIVTEALYNKIDLTLAYGAEVNLVNMPDFYIDILFDYNL